MDVCIYNGKANSQAGNMKVFLMATQKGQGCKILSLGFQKFMHFFGKFSKGPWAQERTPLGFIYALEKKNPKS